MKGKPKRQTVCSRGHTFEGSGPCPKCWPGYYDRANPNKYQSKITKLLKQARPKLATQHQLEFKNLFGAVGGYINRRIFISCGKFGIAFRLPPDTLDVLFREKGVKHLKYFPKGHVKKEYAVLSKRMLENKHKLKKLVDESIKYVLSS